MLDPVVRFQCGIQFTDIETQTLAAELSAALKEVGLETTPAYSPPAHATFGTPEVVLTIVMASVAKAVVISALHAIERRLKRSKRTGQDQRIQIVINNPEKAKKRFPFSLRDVTDDAIDEFVSGIIDFVAAI